MSPKLSIIIVSYNTKRLLYNCLKTVTENISVSNEIFVVDNASHDDSAQMVAKEFPKVHLIKNDANVGYNRANNQALKKASGDYFFLLNPDTLVMKEAIEQLVNFLDNHPKVGIIGPQIVNLAGKRDLSVYPLPNLLDTIQEGSLTYSLPMIPGLSRLIYRRRYLSSVAREKIIDAGWVSGAALMIRKKLFNLIGPKDENLYAYAEEADWCLKAHKLNYKVVYFPRAQIIHIGSASSSQNWQLKCQRVESSYRERLYFAQKYFQSLAYHFLRFYLFFELWTKVLLRTFFTWQEPQRSEYLGAYNRALDNLVGIGNNKNSKLP